MTHEFIQSLQNARIKNLVRLQEGHHRRRQQKYLIEGRRELERALAAGVVLKTIYYCEEFFQHPKEGRWLDQFAGEKVRLARAAFQKCSQRESPDGWLGVAEMQERKIESLVITEGLVVVVEQPEKPGNLGTLVRTARAAGADALLVCDPVCELFNPHVIRNSQGVCFDLPMVATTNEVALLWLQDHGLQVVLTSPEGSIPFWKLDFSPPTAIILGSEKAGLSPFWMGRTDFQRISIPMHGLADSLNLSAAAAVVLFEVVRQRQSNGEPVAPPCGKMG